MSDDDALIDALIDAIWEADGHMTLISYNTAKAALAVCRPVIERETRERWIKAMDSVLTREQSYLFRDICAAAIRETGE